MTLTDHHAKKESRLDRHRALMEKNTAASQAAFDQAHKMADVIPFGQPILVGHHSEKTDRNYRARISGKFDKAVELADKAEYHKRQIQRIEAGKAAISADDPDAIELLKEKLENRIKAQDFMRAANKIMKSKKLSADQKKARLLELGQPEETVNVMMSPGEYRSVKLFGESEYVDPDGFPAFALTNNNGNIKRIQGRIVELERARAEKTTEIQIGDISIINSVEENRIMIIFPDIPAEHIRAVLKASGFRWAPSRDAWLAYRSAAWRIPGIVQCLTAMPAYVSPAAVQGVSES